MPTEQEAYMANELTEGQRKVLLAVEAFMHENLYPPTRAELAELLGMASHNGPQEHLVALEKKGYVKLIPGTARGIQVLRSSS